MLLAIKFTTIKIKLYKISFFKKKILLTIYKDMTLFQVKYHIIYYIYI